MTPWAYDVIASFYDEDMGRSADPRSVAWYVRRAKEAVERTGGPVLELGCGTGRITLALAASAIEVVAVDRSRPMLDVMSRKLADAGLAGLVHAIHLDMRHLDVAAGFAAVLCPFSALAYVVDEAERVATLAGVRRCLAPGGSFLLDMFIPDPAVEGRPGGVDIQDYRRLLPAGAWAPALVLERSKRVTPVGAPRVNAIDRCYRFLDGAGLVLREVSTTSVQRSYEPEELLALLATAGFSRLHACGDFDPAVAPSRPARTLAVQASLAC